VKSRTDRHGDGGEASASRVYRTLLLAYPATFRAAYGGAAADVFRQLHADARARGGWAVTRLWARTVPAVCGGGLAERWSAWRGARAARGAADGAGLAAGGRIGGGGNDGGNHSGRGGRNGGGWRRAVAALDALAADSRLAVRALRRRPAFTMATVGLIGLGVGAAATVYSVVDGVLLRPLPYPEPERLVTFAKGSSAVPLPDYEDWRDGTRSFTRWAASWDVSVVLAGAGEPIRIEAARVTAELLPLLGAHALRGRLLAPASPSQTATAVLTHSIWRTRFGADPAVLNRTILLDGEPFTVVGVLAPDYVAPESLELDDVEVYVPLDVGDEAFRRRSMMMLSVVAQLAPAASLESARVELSGVAARLAEAYPEDWRGSEGAPIEIVAETLTRATVGDIGDTLAMFLAAGGLMVLIACANVASLSLARATERNHETAVRAALGASRRRVAAYALTESVVLGLAGGAVGLVLARAGVLAFHAFEPGGIPRAAEVALDARILVFAAALSVVTAFIFGLAPAVSAAAVGAHAALRDDDRSATGGRRRARFRSALVVGEIGLALTLLAAAGVLAHGFARLSSEPTGFQSDGLLTARLDAENALPAERRAAFVEAIVGHMAATPGVEAVGASWQLPFGRGRCCFRSSAWALDVPGDTVSPYVHPVTEDYFAALGIPIRAGRALTSRDRPAVPIPPPGPRTPGVEPVAPDVVPAVVNSRVAAELWPGASALGRRFRIITFRSTEFEVVGVVDPVRHWGLAAEPGEDVYVPMAAMAAWLGLLDVAIRHDGPDEPIVRAIRQAARELAPALPVGLIERMDARVARSIATPRFYATLLLAFAALALLLAAAGVYGTMLYTVGQRRREFGVRIALGARTGDLTRLVLRRGLAVVALGMAAGLAGSFIFTRVLASLVYEVSVIDPMSLALAAATLAAAALLACWLPARRAARTDPIRALK
jgi:putative ABC transport system permease protein